MPIKAKISLQLVLTLWLNLSCAFGQTYEVGETARLLQGLPADAADLVVRADGCVHWRGEEATDKERATEIQKALKELKCSGLRKDSAAMREKYQDNRDIIKALDYVQKYYIR
jgi:hypothetical protein